jgi:hypothetical protein
MLGRLETPEGRRGLDWLAVITLVVTVAGVLAAVFGFQMRPERHTVVLVGTYFAAGIALVAGSYLLVSFTASGQRRHPIAREIVAIILIFVAWLLTWAATLEVYYMQTPMSSSWSVLVFNYDDKISRIAKLEPFLAPDNSTVLLRVTGSQQYLVPPSMDAPQLQYKVQLDNADVPGGPWTFDPQYPTTISLPPMHQSSFAGGMHFLSVVPLSHPYLMQLTFNCIIEIQGTRE